MKKGIENLFPVKLFKDCFYDEKVVEERRWRTNDNS